jgi:hypothetical protein
MTVEMLFVIFAELVVITIGGILSGILLNKYFLNKNKKEVFWATLALMAITTKPLFFLLGQIYFFLSGSAFVSGMIFKMGWQFSSISFVFFIVMFLATYLKVDLANRRYFINSMGVLITIFCSFYEFGSWNLAFETDLILDAQINAFGRDVMLTIQGFIWLLIFGFFSTVFFSRVATSTPAYRKTERFKGFLILGIVGLMIIFTDVPEIWANLRTVSVYYLSLMWMALWFIFYYVGMTKLFILPARIDYES